MKLAPYVYHDPRKAFARACELSSKHSFGYEVVRTGRDLFVVTPFGGELRRGEKSIAIFDRGRRQ